MVPFSSQPARQQFLLCSIPSQSGLQKALAEWAQIMSHPLLIFGTNSSISFLSFRGLQNVPGLRSQVVSHQQLIFCSNSHHFLSGPAEHTWHEVTGDVPSTANLLFKFSAEHTWHEVTGDVPSTANLLFHFSSFPFRACRTDLV